jgi:hypothetical protein
MMEVLNFIFQDIWHFLGTWLLLAVIASMFRGMVMINHPIMVEEIEEEEDEEKR